jgi:hypothetical protein
MNGVSAAAARKVSAAAVGTSEKQRR